MDRYNRIAYQTRSQSGQVLLFVVLLATLLVTVGLSLSRVSVDEARISKLEEESKRAFAAAEAGLEAALQQGDINDLGTLNLGTGITGSAKLQTTQTANFTIPDLKKDEQFSFYLSTYDLATQQITGAAYGSTLTISRNAPAGSYCGGSRLFAVELTFINAQTNTIATRKIIDECSIIEGTADEVVFDGLINLATAPSHLLIVRILAPDTTFPGATITINHPTGLWPLQGKTIVSEAKTATGVVKKIQLFQSYPQIPAEFWITSF